MKKITLLTVTGIILFCIVPVSTIHALLIQGQNNTTPDSDMAACNQNSPQDICPRLNNPDFEDNRLTNTMKKTHSTLIARGGSGAGGAGSGAGGGVGVSGKSKGSGSRGNNNQNVQRRGYGRSEMGENNDTDEKPKENKDNEAEWEETEWEKSEW